MLTWLTNLVAPLNIVLFHLGADAVSWAELLGFITGGACVYLVVRESIHNFWVGIANAAFFLVLFATSRLWADSGLQIVYIVLGFVGWWQWLHGGKDRTALTVRSADARVLIANAVFILAATLGLTVLLRQVHDVAPFWDALTTAMSLSAQYLLNTKRIENWWLWIAVDVVYIPLYFTKHLDLTGIVYVLFLALSVAGLRSWTKALRAQRAAASAADLGGGQTAVGLADPAPVLR